VLTAAITAVLLAAGGAIGAWIAGSPDRTAAAAADPQNSAGPGAAAARTPNDTGYGSRPATPGVLSGGPGPGPGPGPHGPPPRLPKPGRPGLPRQQVRLSQTTGSSRTIFKVYGYGWPPGQPLTLTLMRAGADLQPQPLAADAHGNFNYWINVDHQFFADGLPSGSYRVEVAGPSGVLAATTFTVQGS
jgi:hypothetical protein